MLAERARRLLPALWLGLMLGVAALATPAPFALLARADAGRVVARILGQEAWLSLLLGVAVLLLERQRARIRSEHGAGSVFSGEMLLALGAVFCTVAGYFGVQAVLPAARAGQSGLSFGQWHAVSVACFGVKALLVLALAWRASAPAAAVNPRPSS